MRQPSPVTRLAIGTAFGALVGLAGFLVLPYAMPDIPEARRWGLLLWYGTLGAMVGLLGTLDRDLALELPGSWRLRAPLIGGWMNFVMALASGERAPTLAGAMLGPADPFASSFWAALEGALISFVIGFAATRFGGDGPKVGGTTGGNGRRSG